MGKLRSSGRGTIGRGTMLLCLLMVFGLSFSPVAVSGQSFPDVFDPDSVAMLPPQPAAEEAALPHMSTGLSKLYTEAAAGQLVDERLAGTLNLDDSNQRVRVTLIMLDETSAQQALAALPEMGGEVLVSFQTWIDAWVPVVALEQAAALPGVSLIQEPREVLPVDANSARQLPDQGSFERELYAPLAAVQKTQGVLVSGANLWHNAGWNGAGVKVAVIDSFKYYQNAIAAGELPGNIKIYSPDWSPISLGSPHGTACAEIIYDMAPGVLFTFASPNSPTAMAGMILELAKQGNKIISSSIGWQGLEPGDGSGVINNAIKTAYQQYGTLFVQAAGNEGKHHWDGLYNDTNGDHWHEFVSGTTYIWLQNAVLDPVTKKPQPLPVNRIKDDYDLKVNLRWSSWPVTANDYDLHLVRWNGAGVSPTIVASSMIRQTGNQPPTESIRYEITQAGYYGIAVQRWWATGAEVLDLSGHWLPDFDINVPARSLIDAAASPYALTVGAVDVSTLALEPYSSQGPTKGPGGVIAGGITKPHLAGFANVNTWSYGTGIDKFNGTSSATPHVAGAAALVMQAYPSSHPYYIWRHLISVAQDRGPVGVDNLYGYGALKMWNQPPSNIQNGQSPPQQAPCTDCAPKVINNVLLPMISR